MWPPGFVPSTWIAMQTSSVGSDTEPGVEKMAVDGGMLEGICDADLQHDLGIDIRLHRVKILSSLAARRAPLLPVIHNIAKAESAAGEKHKEEEKATPAESDKENGRNEAGKDDENQKEEEKVGGAEEDVKNAALLLKAVEGPLMNSVFAVGDSGATLGRHSGMNSVVVPETYISRRHCQVVGHEGRFFLEDLGSTTGTFVMIKGRLPLKLSTILNWTHDVETMFQMGLSEFQVIELSLDASPRCVLEIYEGPAKSRKTEVGIEGIEVGREKGNGIAVPEDQQMSGHHAKISFVGGRFCVQDEGSTNKYFAV